MNLSLLFEQLLPAQPCVLCTRMSRNGLWCEACERALPYLHAPLCANCALPIASGTRCGHCLSHPPKFSACSALCPYTFPWDKLIQRLKFANDLALADALARKLASRISSTPDLLIAMPLHPRRLRERGYNQSQLLAERLARETGLPLLTQACRRVRDTAAQSTLPLKERGRNMRNAFVCDVDLKGQRVALVDDVLTSGASLNALAAAVLKRGASGVEVWVVARTLHERRFAIPDGGHSDASLRSNWSGLA